MIKLPGCRKNGIGQPGHRLENADGLLFVIYFGLNFVVDILPGSPPGRFVLKRINRPLYLVESDPDRVVDQLETQDIDVQMQMLLRIQQKRKTDGDA